MYPLTTQNMNTTSTLFGQLEKHSEDLIEAFSGLGTERLFVPQGLAFHDLDISPLCHDFGACGSIG